MKPQTKQTELAIWFGNVIEASIILSKIFGVLFLITSSLIIYYLTENPIWIFIEVLINFPLALGTLIYLSDKGGYL